MRVAVTGNIGSGKTLFSEVLSNGRVHILDADREGKALLSQYREEVFEMLNLQLDDDYLTILKSNIMKNRQMFETYNKWMYERLPGIIKNKAHSHENVIVDCALVFEWGIEYIFDSIILVDGGDFDMRKARKGNMDDEFMLLLESYQIPIDEKKRRADIVIENTGSKEELNAQAKQIYSRLFDDN